MQDTNLTEVKASVTRVVYKPGDADSPFRILGMNDEKGNEFSAKGDFSNIDKGTRLILHGKWGEPYNGRPTFICAMFEVILPTTAAGMQEYLASGCVPGCSSSIARRIVKKFGDDTFRILDEEPDRLTEVWGIGVYKKERIKAGWEKQKAYRDMSRQLFLLGIHPKYVQKVRREFGDQAIEVIKENPYRLCEIKGISFKTADEVALKNGIEKESPMRITSGILYYLDVKCSLADTFALRWELLNETSRFLGVKRELIENGLIRLAEAESIVCEKDAVYKKNLYKAEVRTARKLRELASSAPLYCKKYPIEKIEKRLGIQYDEIQKSAITAAAEEGVLVITGGPGTGKSTILSGILMQFKMAGLRVAMMAPTGRAAKRMSEATGEEATTIHRYLMSLDYDGYETYGDDNEEYAADTDVIIVDETSMVDVSLMGWLISYVKKGMRLILIGDADQLPSVGPGTVLKDIIRSGVVRTVRLEHTFRQKEGSTIIENAKLIKAGRPGLTVNGRSGFYYVEVENDTEKLENKVVDIMANHSKTFFGCEYDDVQVLAPIGKESVPVSAQRLNKKIQDAINPLKGPEVGGFREGDRVINTRNNYQKEVFNGDVGKIEKIDEENKIVHIGFDDRDVEYEFEEMDDIKLSYAMTVHKSQGSEYPVVIIPVTMCHFTMLQRTLFYTAVTRAKKNVVLVGEKRAVGTAIRNVGSEIRKSRLYERLVGLI